MNSKVIGGLVEDVDDKGVTLSCPYCWTWILPINCCYQLIMAQSRNSQVVHLYVFKQWKSEIGSLVKAV